MDWRRYVSAVRRYGWWILGLGVLGTAGGLLGGRFMPRRYQAQATIWIQSGESRGGGSRGPIGADQLFESSAWVDLLKSYVVLDDVARDLRLYITPEARYASAFTGFKVSDTYHAGRYHFVVDRSGSQYQLLGSKGEELFKGAMGDSVGQSLGFLWAPTTRDLPAGSDVTFTVRPLRDAAKGLGRALAVTVDLSGNFLRVTLTGEDPVRAAKIVNAVAERYVAVGAELKRAKLGELARLLNEQLVAAGANLRQAEKSLADFRVRTISVTPAVGGASAGISVSPRPVGSPQLEQEQLRWDRHAIEQVLAQMRDSSGTVDGLAFIGAVQRSVEMGQALRELTTKEAEQRALRYRYTDDHPTLQRVTNEIALLQGTTIPVLARSLMSELSARERVLAQQISSENRELREIPQRVIEDARLAREVDLATSLYTSVQQRYNEARLADASTTADVRILDAAVAPQEALKDTASRLLVLGCLAGLAFGLFGAVVIDRLDPRMRYPDQVTRQMGLPILGVLPHVKDRKAGPDDEHVTHLIEAMRSIRLSLMHFHGGNGPVVVTVTSPGVSDGKSFVSANLALACAESGQPTLLIDGDARRGGLHRALHRTRKPGLTDCLAGHTPLEGVTQTTMYPTLDFIGAGSRFQDAPELLGSPAMTEVLERVRAQYKIIIVDSPPLGSGVDPYTLGTLTGSLLLVLRTGTTNLTLARTKLTVLDHLPIRLLGVVLNDVRPDGLYRYYSYLPGYAAVNEREGFAVAGRQPRGVL